MCAATAAAIAGTVATVASAAGAAYSATQGSSGGSGGPSGQQSLKGFAPATGLQSYTARLMALNANARPPTFDEWVNSGGSKRFELDIPDFTPKEAEQLKLVGEYGERIPGYDPREQDALTTEQLAWIGNTRKRIKAREPHGYEYATMPEEQLADLYNRQQNLRRKQAAGILGEQGARRLDNIERKIEKIRQNPSNYLEEATRPDVDNSTGSRLGRIFGTAPWDEGRK